MIKQIKLCVSLFLILSLFGCATTGDTKGDGVSGKDVLVGAAVTLAITYFIKKVRKSDLEPIYIPEEAKEIKLGAKDYSVIKNTQYVNNHEVRKIVSLGEEKNGYALYTYLLLPKKNYMNQRNSGIANKYRAALNSLLGLSLNSSVTFYNKNETNLILVPVINQGNIALENYNFALSLKIINSFVQAAKETKKMGISNQFRFNEGPFLVTTMKPLLKTDDPIYFLYADMSKLPESAIKQIIAIYKNHLSTKEMGNKPFTKLEKAKINLLSFLTNLNVDLKMIKLKSNAKKT